MMSYAYVVSFRVLGFGGIRSTIIYSGLRPGVVNDAHLASSLEIRYGIKRENFVNISYEVKK